jgi:hypothetical protein
MKPKQGFIGEIVYGVQEERAKSIIQEKFVTSNRLWELLMVTAQGVSRRGEYDDFACLIGVRDK